MACGRLFLSTPTVRKSALASGLFPHRLMQSAGKPFALSGTIIAQLIIDCGLPKEFCSATCQVAHPDSTKFETTQAVSLRHNIGGLIDVVFNDIRK